MIALATFALLASSGDAFSISNSRMRSDTSLQMAGSKKKIVITGILMHNSCYCYFIDILIFLCKRHIMSCIIIIIINHHYHNNYYNYYYNYY